MVRLGQHAVYSLNPLTNLVNGRIYRYIDIILYIMKTEIDCVDFCKALSDPTRQKILEMLLSGEKTVSEIVDAFNLSQPTISHHLDLLTRYGLLASRKEGKQVFYATDQEKVSWCCGRLMAKFQD
jgi:ArsR family transcriptional regulator